VTSLYGSLQGQGLWCKGNCNESVEQLTGTAYGARGIVTSLYGTLQRQYMVQGELLRDCIAVYRDSLWCKGDCNEFVWQLTGTEFMVQG